MNAIGINPVGINKLTDKQVSKMLATRLNIGVVAGIVIGAAGMYFIMEMIHNYRFERDLKKKSNNWDSSKNVIARAF